MAQPLASLSNFLLLRQALVTCALQTFLLEELTWLKAKDEYDTSNVSGIVLF